MSTALTPPTPENVADMLTSGDNDYHDGNDWWPSIGATGNIIEIGITPVGEDYETKLPEVHFRAVVAAVSEDAMLEGPLDIIGTPGGRVLLAHDSLMDLSPDQAYQAAAQLVAAAALAAEIADGQTAAPARCACSEFGQCPACGGPPGDERLVDGPNGGA